MAKKAKKTPKMKEMKVTLTGGRKSASRPKAKKGKMSFRKWLDHYVKASGGNPV